MSQTARLRCIGAVCALLVALVVLGPALGRGYLLRVDMVFVPRLPFDAHVAGVDGSVPRAVPSDAVVAALSLLAPGWVVQKILLVAGFVLLGAGVAGWMRSPVGAAAASVAATWSPFMAQRLAMGHWPYLLGYALLPWVARAADQARRGEPGALTRLGWWLIAAAATGSTGALIATLLAMCVLMVPRPRRQRLPRRSLVAVLALVVAVNATWWYPSFFLARTLPADPEGVRAFAAGADTPFGVLGSVLTAGGIWNSEVWFATRALWLPSGVALILAIVCLLSVLYRVRLGADPALIGTLIVAVVGLALTLLGAFLWSRPAMVWLVTELPGGGLLRDTQKLLAPLAMLLAIGAGYLAQSVSASAARLGVHRVLAWLTVASAVLWPVATLSDLAWGHGARWKAVDYPASVDTMRRTIDRLPAGAVATMPWNSHRSYGWNPGAIVLDPWPRLLPRRVLVSDDLRVSGRLAHGEDPYLARVSTAVDQLQGGRSVADGAVLRAALQEAGASYVLVELDQPGARESVFPAMGATLVQRVDGLALYRLPDAPTASADPRTGAPPWAGWALAGAAVLGWIALHVTKTTGRR